MFRRRRFKDRNDWIQYGLDQNWASGFCYQHQSPPVTESEAKEWFDDGNDICIPVFRMWFSEN